SQIESHGIARLCCRCWLRARACRQRRLRITALREDCRLGRRSLGGGGFLYRRCWRWCRGVVFAEAMTPGALERKRCVAADCALRRQSLLVCEKNQRPQRPRIFWVTRQIFN